MLGNKKAFSSFSVADIEAARRFYAETLDLKAADTSGMGLLELDAGGGHSVVIYPKPDHQPAAFTVLNFAVDDIDAAVDELTRRGVRFERYEGFEQDEKGIARPPSPDHGPPIAWFTDPAGNILAVLEAD
ncbi:VOC family protein [soil metagenome]